MPIPDATSTLPVIFARLAVHQDFLWFGLIVAWILALVVWFRHPRKDWLWRLRPWIATGPGIDLDICSVLRVFLVPNTMTLMRELFASLDARATPRVLVRTNHCDYKPKLPARIPVLTPEVPVRLDTQGVRLPGLDLRSGDQTDDPWMQIHHRLEAASIFVRENPGLLIAAPGLCELIALPLKSIVADGPPIRAGLRTRN
jgi:hypothetical protein